MPGKGIGGGLGGIQGEDGLDDGSSRRNDEVGEFQEALDFVGFDEDFNGVTPRRGIRVSSDPYLRPHRT